MVQWYLCSPTLLCAWVLSWTQRSFLRLILECFVVAFLSAACRKSSVVFACLARSDSLSREEFLRSEM